MLKKLLSRFFSPCVKFGVVLLPLAVFATELNVIDGDAGSNTLLGTAGADQISGYGGNDILYGYGGDDVLIGHEGNDSLKGGEGSDQMTGGAGNDNYYVDSVADTVIEAAGEGTDEVFASIDYTLGDNVEYLVLQGTADINGVGNALNNRMQGNSAANTLSGQGGDDVLYGYGGDDSLDGHEGNDLLNGGEGNDQMTGGLGNDKYYVDSVADAVIESAGEGTDEVFASIDYTLGDNVEYLVLQGTADINGVGNALNNLMQGNSAANTLSGQGGDDVLYGYGGDDSLDGHEGNDRLNGGEGNDQMTGGVGNDQYYVDSVADAVIESVGEGVDEVFASIDYTLGDNVENLVLQGTADINGVGNALNNLMQGNSAANTLSGQGGDDVLYGYGGDDSLDAHEGNDRLNGGEGNDQMTGGIGNDKYYVDSVADAVIELAGEGIDEVFASIDYTLGDNVENLVLQGTAEINGVGNALNNLMQGNSAANTLSGQAGPDVLYGYSGDDILLGGGGNDIINSGEGSDTIHVGDGQDVILEQGSSADIDIVQFATGISKYDLWFVIAYNHLTIQVIGTDDSVVISNWDTDKPIERIVSGTDLLEKNNVATLVNAMAAFSPPQGVGAELTQAMRDALYPVIDSVYQLAGDPDENPPSAPDSVNAPAQDDDGVFQVSWASSAAATSYELEQQLDSGSWVQVYAGADTFYDTVSVNDGTYRYRVRACINSECSYWVHSANTTLVAHRPGVPASISASAPDTTGAFTVSWSAATGDVANYELYENTSGDWSNKVYEGLALQNHLIRSNGSYEFRVRACNTEGTFTVCSDYQTLPGPVVVDGVIPGDPNNQAPVFSSVPVTQAVVGTQYQYNVAATDADGDTVTYYLYDGPTGMTINLTTGVLQWTPAAAVPAPGEYVKVKAYDNNGGRTWQEFYIVVTTGSGGGNTSPVFNTQPATSAQENTLYQATLDVTDAEGDPLTYTLVTSPAGMTISAGGILEWTPGFEDAGDHSVSLSVSDGQGGIASTSFTLTVANTNRVPVANDQTLSVQEDTALAITLTATDGDGDSLTYSVISSTSNGTLSGSGTSLSYTPGANFTGSDSFTFRANDGSADSNLATVSITVNGVNDAPVFQFSPQITATENLGYSTTALASDAENGVIQYSLPVAPDGMTINSLDGVIYWVPGFDTAGGHFVAVEATDDQGLSSRSNFIIHVSNSNRLPTFTSTANLSGDAGSVYNYAASASDEDTDDTLIYSLPTAPAGMLINPDTGLVSWSIPADAPASVAVSLQVDDQQGGVVTQNFNLQIHTAASNQAPVIDSAPVATTPEASLYSYALSVLDPDDSEHDFALTASPAGALVNPRSGVISWFPTDNYVQGNTLANTLCHINPADLPDSDIQITEKWHWPLNTGASTTLPQANYKHVMMTPLVAQTNDDNGDSQVNERDIPDIIYTAFSDTSFTGGGAPGHIRIISGADGSELAILDQHTIEAFANLAVADINNDGAIEIIAMGTNDTVYALTLSGGVVWQNTDLTQDPYNWGAPTIADLDGDGNAEVVVQGGILSGQTGQLLGTFSPYNAGVSTHGGVPIVADINGDNQQEVIVGGNAYNASGTPLWTTGHNGFSAIGNLDADADPEIVVVSAGTVYIINHDGSEMPPISLPGAGGAGGAPTVADFDGDGEAEIGVAGSTQYTVFNRDGTQLWSMPIQDTSSRRTASSVFDFNGDGKAEVVYADERTFWIFNGADGTPLVAEPHSSATTYEYPVIADIDNDNHAEIIIAANSAHGGNFAGIRVFEDIQDRWVNTRRIWNQHAYSIDNINSDGTVPAQPAKGWQTHNTFRLNTFPDRDPLHLADLRAGHSLYNDDTATLSVQVQNRGLAVTDAPFTVRVYRGIPASGGVLIADSTLTTLAAGAEEVVTFNNIDASVLSDDIYLVVDEEQVVTECVSDNNQSVAVLFKVEATDSYTQRDEQLYLLNVDNINNAPTADAGQATQSQWYADGDISIQVQASDLDTGDALSYTLSGVPAGISINQQTGLISGSTSIPGIHTATVTITDLSGAQTTIDLEITVVANTAPTINSSAPTTVDEGDDYVYQLQATDPENDAIRFSELLSPAALNVDAATGIVSGILPAEYTLPLATPLAVCQAGSGEFSAIKMTEKWHWLGGDETPEMTDVYGPVLVGQLTDDNGDGFINEQDNTDIVVMASRRSDHFTTLSVVDGETKTNHFTLQGDFASPGSAALGDIDGDGIVEIIVSNKARSLLEAYEHDGVLKWSQPHGPGYGGHASGNRDGITLADLDGDGSVEIIAGNGVYNNLGIRQWTFLSDKGGYYSYGTIPIVADIDQDGVQEIIAGRTVYRADGSLYRPRTNLPHQDDGYNAIGNFDSDDSPEIVLVADGYVTVIDDDGTTLKWHEAIPGGGLGGAPTVADLDGDGEPEVGVAGASRYVVYETDGTIKWSMPTQDQSSNRTGSSVFDFNGDGRVEVVYADERNLRVYDGSTGAELVEVPNGSATTLEYPVIADIDNDGQAEILVGANYYNDGGLRAYEGDGQQWMPTRRIWNQHSYHITNINDDGTIPMQEQPSWLTHNSYRLNTFMNRSALDLSDLTVSAITYDDSAQQLSVTVLNRGTIALTSAVDVVIASGATELTTATVNNLDSQASTVITIDNLTPEQLVGDVSVTIDPLNTVKECIEDNNTAKAAALKVRASDTGGLSDQQNWLITVNNINERPVFPETAASTSIDFEDFNTSNCSSAVAFSPDRYASQGVLLTGMAGNNPLCWNASTSPTVQESDDGGAWSGGFGVIGNNNANTGVRASFVDPENGGAPTTVNVVSVYALSGPGSDLLSDNTALIAYDSGGFEIARDDADTSKQFDFLSINQPGIASILVTAGVRKDAIDDLTFFNQSADGVINLSALELLSLSLTATDADLGDSLTYIASGAPEGFFIDSSTGAVSWRPGNNQVGSHMILITATDLAGLSSSYALHINVTAVEAPVIISTPTTRAYPDQQYSYQAEAIDNDIATLSYSLPIAHPAMAIDPNTGLITWTPSSSDIGSHAVTLRVTDADSNVTDQNFNIVVAAAFSNTAPVITSTPVTTATIGNLYSYSLVVSDVDGDAISLSVSGQFGMQLSSANELLWTPASDQYGDHDITITADDGNGGVTTQQFTITVPGGTTPPVNTLPVITSVPALSVTAGSAYQYPMLVTDDGSVSYNLVTNPNGMTIDANGVVSWSPTVAQIGSHPVTISVSDGLYTVSQNFAINVLALDASNTAPAISSTPVTVVSAGKAYSYAVSASDADSDALSYQLEANPAGMTIDSQGVISWPTQASDNGNHTVVVAVFDGRGGYARQAYSVFVYPDVGPLFLSVPGNLANVDQLYQYTIDVVDLESDPITLNLVSVIDGMTLTNGVINWTPTVDQKGVQSFTIEASDGNVTNRQFINVLVIGNQPPVINSTAPIRAVIDQVYSYPIDATDPEGQVLTYQPLERPAGMTVSSTGLVSWQPAAADEGPHVVSVRISDPLGESVVHEFVVYAVTDSVSPIITSDAQTRARTEVGYSYQVTAVDPDNDPITYELVGEPAGMTIDANGLILWSPTLNDLGIIDLQIIARDDNGNSDQQSFALIVTAPGPWNRRLCE